MIAARMERVPGLAAGRVTAGSAALIKACMSASVSLEAENLPERHWVKLSEGWTWAYPAEAMVEAGARILAGLSDVPFRAPLGALTEERGERARKVGWLDRRLGRDQPPENAPGPEYSCARLSPI